jgi:uncharacterized lipoprotein YajG
VNSSESKVRSAEYKTQIFGCFAVAVLMTAVFLAGCAEKGPILLNVGYQVPAEKAASTSKIVIGVSPFRDARGVLPSVMGKRTIPSGMQNDLVVKGTVAEVATASLRDALAARGIAVKNVSPWDLTAENMPEEGTALVLGGEVKVFWLDSTASALNTHLKASVQLKVVAGDTAAKKVFRTIEVNSMLDHDVLYSRERLENIISEALSLVVDQVFRDEELKKRLQ